MKIGVIIGSTRPARVRPGAAQWVHEIATQRGDGEYEIVDIAGYALPLLDEPCPPSFGAEGLPTLCTPRVIDFVSAERALTRASRGR